MSKDSKLYQTEADHMIETTIGFLPDEDGILKTFIDRYTTMLIHDSIYMEEVPGAHGHEALMMMDGGHHGDFAGPHQYTIHHDADHAPPSLEALL